jgi:phosphotransacetylase
MDFIKTDETRFSHFRIAKVKDESMVIEYNKEKNRGKCEQEVLRGKEREIEVNINQFFKAINEKNYFEIQSKNEKDQTYRVKFNYTIREREKFAFEEVLRSMQTNPYYRNDCKKLI